MRHPTFAILLALAACAPAGAQELRRQLESGPDGRVLVRYAARPDVCGSATMLRIGFGSGFGESHWVWTRSESADSDACERAPVQALVTRAEGQIVAIRIGVGTGAAPAGATDLGPVPAARAAAFFLDLAARTDGRLGRDALLAAVLADSADPAPALIGLARNPALSRGLRESAVGWLGRELADPARSGAIVPALLALARDADGPRSVRTRAADALAHGGAAGTAALASLAESDDPGVARAALAALGRSSDPRAREPLRRAVRDPDLAEPLRVQAIRSLGSRDATPADVAELRRQWTALEGEQARGAILDVMAEIGGTAAAEWLLGVAADDRGPSTQRARAVRAAERAGAGAEPLIRLYDQAADRRVREAVLDALSRIGDRAALAKLQGVAKDDTDPNLRRSALRRLAQLGGDDAVAAIEAVLTRP